MRLPQIAVFTRVAPYHGGIHLFSDGTGYFHADYFSGWEAAQLQKVLDECENDSMQSAPDAWCEDHVTFRDAPKAENVEMAIGWSLRRSAIASKTCADISADTYSSQPSSPT